MDYKKRNEEILEKLRALRDSWASTNNRAAKEIEEAIPELIESEDEKIRKEIITLVNAHGQDMYKEEMLAWLEKQGEQKPADKVEPKFKVGDKIRRKTPRRYDKDMQVTRIESNYYLCNHLGKFSSESISFSEESNYELVEQKYAEKIEPKFNIGDIITNGKIIGKVDENENNKYHGWFGYDKDLSVHYADIPDVENWHLWTIQDAKDGDVVVDKSDGTLGIFLSIGSHPDGGCYNDPSYCFLHCHCDDEFFYADFENGNEIDSDNLVPATKEQHDLLFQKMHEAGYEWDAEKNELKKIEQKSSEWNEEDEKFFKTALWHISYSISNGKSTDFHCDTTDWFKSLKDRVQLQPKQEWSKEDERIKNNLLSELTNLSVRKLIKKETEKKYASWLKSLRPQPLGSRVIRRS